jgi:protein SCO1/2
MRHLLTFVLSVALGGSRLTAGGTLAKVPQGTELPPQLKEVGIDQRLSQQIPLDATFLDQHGQQVRIGQLLGKRPAVLALVYYECPMLCTMVLNGLLRTLRVMTTMNVGEDFDIITISFDPSETPQLADKKKFEYLERYNRPAAARGWHFLVGDQANISKVTQAAGYRYSKDPRTGQWAHASGIMVLTPEGKLARYLYGVEYSARDLRLSLVEASQGKIGSIVDATLLYCFHYDPATGKYSLFIMNLTRLAGVMTVLALLIFWFVSWKGRRKQHHVEIPIIS